MSALPVLSAVQHLSLPALHDLLETVHQLLLPKVSCCSIEYLHQLLTGRKQALTLLHVRHFCLSEGPNTRTKVLSTYCEKDTNLQRYIPDGGCNDREFLVKLLATVALDRIVDKQKEALLLRYRIRAESGEVQPAFQLRHPAEEQVFIVSAIPE